MRIKFWTILTLVSLASLVYLPTAAQAQFPLPSPRPQATQAPAPADPRQDQLKAGLERQGLKVLGVYAGLTKSKELQWFAETAARYAQPNWKDVGGQAFTIWGAMWEVAAKDPPQTWFSGMQVWAKYGIALHVRLEHLTVLVNELASAKTDAEKQTALQKFNAQIVLTIWDFERQVFTENKDFINKNFAS